MLTQLEEGIAFTFVELLEVEHILVKRDRFLDVAYFNGHVVASVNLNSHAEKIRRKACPTI